MSVIQDGVAKNETTEIWKVCHKLTGSAELLGFKDFGQRSRRLDLELKTMPQMDLHTAEIHEYLQQAEALSQRISNGFPHLQNYL
ncbi:hypothetical protein D3C72_1862730 [compost metagenome]